MLPEVVWSMPEYGTFNLHASLLPQYRGAAPINWAVINGDTETGVTTFFIRHEIDTGSIIFQEKEPILPDDTAGTLHDRLMVSGAGLVVKTVQAIAQGTYQLTPQNSSVELKAAPKIFKEDCRINWDNNADSVYDFIRGLSPYPAAWTILNGVNYKLLKTCIPDSASENEPGTFSSDAKTFLNINCRKGTIGVREIQMEGKKCMSIDEFLRGNKI
jgi:methionyl-tRNA formyltransferase